MGLISEETIQRVTDVADIVDVIGTYFPLKRAGSSFRALCPFHREKSPSFHVNPTRQTFHCFGCGAGGGVLRFVMDYEKLDFPTAVRRLAQRYNVPVIEDASADDGRRGLRDRLLAIHAEAAAFFQHHLLKEPSGERARTYLRSRAIDSGIAKAWGIGYAPDSWDELLVFLRGKRFSDQELAESGLTSTNEAGKTYARFRDRVMFPIRSDHGEVIAFSGRVLDPDAKTAKYVNSPETPIFTKGRVLYGLDMSKRDLIEKNAAIVCEGQLDLISAFEAGVRNVIAPQGTAFTPDQARLLARFVETVLLCFDSDTAGRKAAARSLPALLSHGLTVKVVTLPDGEDPDSLIRKQGPGAFLERVATARDYFDHAVDSAGSLDEPAAKAKLVRGLGIPLAVIKDAALREATIGRLSSRLAIPQDAIRASVRTAANAPAENVGGNEEPAPAPEAIEASPGMKILCQLALQSAEVRDWLRAQHPAAEIEPAGAVLDRLVAADLGERPLVAFLATLDGPSERFLSALADGRELADPLPRATDTWRGLATQRLRARMEELKARLATPGLSSEDILKIQKQILDAKIRVADGFRPSS